MIGGHTIERPKTLFQYQQWVEQQQLASQQQSKLAGDGITTHSTLDDCLNVVLKRLRTRDGLDLQWIHDEYGPDYVVAILEGAQMGLELGLAEHLPELGILRLIDPDGFLVSNSVISSIFVELEALQTNDSTTTVVI